MVDEYRTSGVPFLRSQNVLPHRLDLTDVKFIDDKFHSRLKKSALEPGDVVTVRTGKPGTTAVVPTDLLTANCSDLVITRPGPELDSRWLSYYVNESAAAFVAAHLVGAVQQHFNVGSAKNLELHLPPIFEQRGIAEVLGALDDKIAANATLSAVARNLAVAVVAEASDGNVLLSDLAIHHKRSVAADAMGTGEVWHYSLPAFDDGMAPALEDPSSIKSGKFVVGQPSVLVSKLNPRFPRIWDVPSLRLEPMLASTEFLVLESRFSTSTVLWAALFQRSFSEHLESKVSGTSGSHQRVRPADLLATEVVDVRSLGNEARSKIESLGQRAMAADAESRELAEVRDVLLPQLMSGTIRVKDAEEIVGDVV